MYATEEETIPASNQALQATNVSEVKEVCEVAAQREVSAELQSTTQERQWSTFLQKPKGPKPKPKKAEPEGPKVRLKNELYARESNENFRVSLIEL